MKVLVTGATGFIGNYVILELLRHKVDVIATSRSIEKAKSFEWFDKVDFKEFNINNLDVEENLVHYFSNPDAIIHLAWEGLPNYKSQTHITDCLPLQKRFLKRLVLDGIKNLTVIGTCFEYGMKEGELFETDICEPVTPYGAAKNELRLYLERLSVDNNLNLNWLRLFYMYGKGQSSSSIISQLELALKKGDNNFNMSAGEQERDYLKVTEVVSYIVKVATKSRNAGIVNVCSGKPMKIKQLVKNYLIANNKNIELNLGFYPYNDYEPMSFWGSNKKLNEVIRK